VVGTDGPEGCGGGTKHLRVVLKSDLCRQKAALPNCGVAGPADDTLDLHVSVAGATNVGDSTRTERPIPMHWRSKGSPKLVARLTMCCAFSCQLHQSYGSAELHGIDGNSYASKVLLEKPQGPSLQRAP